MLTLYTKTVCPKCKLVKDVIDREGNLNKVKIINIDEQNEYLEFLKEKGFSALPILQVEDEFYLQPFEIIEVINS